MTDDERPGPEPVDSAVAPAARTRRPLRSWLPPLAAGVVVLTAWIVLGSGGSAASDVAADFRSDRAHWASSINEVAAPFARVDAVAAAQGLAQADFADADAPAWSASSQLPCTLDDRLLGLPGVAPALPAQPLGIASGSYAAAQDTASQDAAAIAAWDRLPDEIAAARVTVDAVCATATALRGAHADAVRVVQESRSLEELAYAASEEVTYSVIEGTTMLSVRCDGVVGCTGIDLAEWGIDIADSWTREFVWGAQAYADAYGTCPTSLAEPCAALAEAYEVRAAAEQAIADAFRAGDAAAIDAAFQQRTIDWDAAWSDAQAAVDDAGGDSIEGLLSQAWVEALEPVAACAEEATIRW